MEKLLIKLGLIPLDKYWMIRLGVLDILNGQDEIERVLDGRENLGGDLKALLGVAKTWKKNKEINVGESGTLFRYLQFAIWKLKILKFSVGSFCTD